MRQMKTTKDEESRVREEAWCFFTRYIHENGQQLGQAAARKKSMRWYDSALLIAELFLFGCFGLAAPSQRHTCSSGG